MLSKVGGLEIAGLVGVILGRSEAPLPGSGRRLHLVDSSARGEPISSAKRVLHARLALIAGARPYEAAGVGWPRSDAADGYAAG